MARAPRAKVPKTSGQGVSRLSYQKGYALGNKGGKTAPSVGGAAPAPSRAAGGKSKLDTAGGINVSYGDTIDPSDLVDVESYAKGKPAKGVNLKLTKAKKLK
jgi:hypothetical protein